MQLKHSAKLSLTVFIPVWLFVLKKQNPQPLESRPLTSISESRDTARHPL